MTPSHKPQSHGDNGPAATGRSRAIPYISIAVTVLVLAGVWARTAYGKSAGTADPGTACPATGDGGQACTKSQQQTLNAVYTLQRDIQPNRFTVKSGLPARLVINVQEEGSGCMDTIMLPKLSKQIRTLTKGETITIDFPTTTPGRYQITCAMGVPRGEIVIE